MDTQDGTGVISGAGRNLNTQNGAGTIVSLYRFKAQVLRKRPGEQYFVPCPIAIESASGQLLGSAVCTERVDDVIAECTIRLDCPERLDLEVNPGQYEMDCVLQTGPQALILKKLTLGRTTGWLPYSCNPIGTPIL